MSQPQRDVMQYQVLIVGAGPAGLSAAIRLKQLANAEQRELSICVLEKASEVGAHTLSGAVIDPIALNELLPDWQALGAPLTTPVKEDHFLYLTERKSFTIPDALLPPLMRNHGNYIISLGALTRWLGEQAEALGVEIYPGFSAVEPLYDASGALKGVISGDMGRARDGSEKPGFAQGIELHADYTLIAEGTRGSLTRQLEARFDLRREAEPQKYGLGFKELWQLDPAQHKPGLVLHAQGWPLDDATGGGAFIYHLENNIAAVGYVVHLNYSNPYLSPFEEFQRFKTHPAIAPMLAGGKRLSYGARTINEGGLQSLPQLYFPGGALIGCAAGFVNVPRIKGSHNAMKSGMLAAEAVFEALSAGRSQDSLIAYTDKLRASWVWQDLDQVRNVKPAISRFGNRLGSLISGAEMWLASFKVRLPWTLTHGKADHETLDPKDQARPIAYPKPDGTLSFDRLSSVFLANLQHDEDQPVHLTLKDASVPIAVNLARYDSPEQRYCPAGVYEIVERETTPRLQINAANCVHCKACDIKDPTQNIVWVPPEGGSGPSYTRM
ncbi:electron transfer flavoprotein-ubiquinone oxidoreductase [Methylobacillus flagellatus]|uniref:electron transfer flavoprotein-ubiquinone oxidoreductase n=1 Tax=Methylobacillus flagellatus TaxID=405 RepID=UPI0010F66151|nr:electron transfer flavoprotein-ubiquinone oxidoreductase [Methylobacillus flagellatus]